MGRGNTKRVPLNKKPPPPPPPLNTPAEDVELQLGRLSAIGILCAVIVFGVLTALDSGVESSGAASTSAPPLPLLTEGELCAAHSGPIPVTVFVNGASDNGVDFELRETHKEDLGAELSDLVDAMGSLQPYQQPGHVQDEQLDLASSWRIFDGVGRRCEGYADVRRHLVLDTREAERHTAIAGDTWPGRQNASTRLYVVPKGLNFVWPQIREGFRVAVPQTVVRTPSGVDVELKTLSAAPGPRVFSVTGFFSNAEADDVIDEALSIDDDSLGLHRSTGGVEGVVSKYRTSENAWLMDNMPTNRNLKHRTLDLLRIAPYSEQILDGMQVLRYNNTKYYTAHTDFFDGPDYDASRTGSNRMATLFFYLRDPEAGGQTAFPDVALPESREKTTALETARALAQEAGIKEGSGEWTATEQCATSLATQPRRGEAVLFYSLNPDGTPDWKTRHIGCPVLKGTKWGANLWIWNNDRPYQPTVRGKNAGKDKKKNGQDNSLLAVFENKASVPVELFFVTATRERSSMQVVQSGATVSFNTFVGHLWAFEAATTTMSGAQKVSPSEWVVPDSDSWDDIAQRTESGSLLVQIKDEL